MYEVIKDNSRDSRSWEDAQARKVYAGVSPPKKKVAIECLRAMVKGAVNTSGMVELPTSCEVPDCQMRCINIYAPTLEEAVEGPCLVKTIGTRPDQEPENQSY